MSRHDGRRPDELRPLSLEVDWLEQPHGSVLYRQGNTIVLCTASVTDSVPRWLHRSGRGWITAEYSLLPASTGERTDREATRGRQGGRTVEIQRLIGRSVRAVADFEALGERTLALDCDVLQADGGTRTASISGAYVAAARALDRFGLSRVLTGSVAAVSIGIVDGEPLLDLDYVEDSGAEVDMNVVITEAGELVEVQATAEREPFTRAQLGELLDLAQLAAAVIAAVAPLGWGEVAIRLAVAAGLGAAVGFERELREREAGLRTHLLVSVGAAVFTLVSAYGFPEFLTGGGSLVRLDPTRIAAQIVTGIGFLGAGAIIREGMSVRGLTTAATLWVVAAIGLASGAGYYEPAVIGTGLVIFSLWPLRLLAYRAIERIRPEERRVVLELRPGQSLAPLLALLDRESVSVESLDLDDERDRRVVTIDTDPPPGRLVPTLSELDYVIAVRWRR